MVQNTYNFQLGTVLFLFAWGSARCGFFWMQRHGSFYKELFQPKFVITRFDCIYFQQCGCVRVSHVVFLHRCSIVGMRKQFQRLRITIIWNDGIFKNWICSAIHVRPQGRYETFFARCFQSLSVDIHELRRGGWDHTTRSKNMPQLGICPSAPVLKPC